ncbi:MAG TPA: helix-turn-helix domain-containing protein, partial [Thermoleophilaceae bacterium]|nr:helix-turn-helix domain-containing protein [Thermoleophilaceae bacterium]
MERGAVPGLRERKKQETRQLIADTARRLFTERSFDAVPVAEVARAANVSEKTVFNYFPTKEDLVYSRLEAFEDEL